MVNYTPWNLRRQILLEEQVIRGVKGQAISFIIIIIFLLCEQSFK